MGLLLKSYLEKVALQLSFSHKLAYNLKILTTNVKKVSMLEAMSQAMLTSDQ
jgi:hypothetical protein